MRAKIYQRTRIYKKDAVRYLIFEILNRPFLIAFIIYIVVVLGHFLNKIFHINFFPLTFELLTFSMGVGIIGMILYSIIWFKKAINKISKESDYLYEGKLNLIMDDNYVTMQAEKNGNIIKTKWNHIKELVVINETAYLMSSKKNDYIIKINKREVIEGNFQDIVNFATSKCKRR